MTTKPVRFYRKDEKIDLPPVPEALVQEANRLYGYLSANGDLVQGLEAIYRYLDQFAPFIADLASCSKGCAHCCRFDVQITTYEASYIHLRSGVPAITDGGITTGHHENCPFLSDQGECGIYSIRPMICRTYHVFGDPALCADPKASQHQYGTAAGGFGNPIYKQLSEWVWFQARYTWAEH